jgi:hypothetical protein
VRLSGLEAQKLLDVGLGPLDARAEHRFQPQMSPDEEVRIRDQASDAAEAVHGSSGLVQQAHDFPREVELTRQRCRMECPIAGGRPADHSSVS